jgi:F-type H+-transporting ATPase subunit epsilon
MAIQVDILTPKRQAFSGPANEVRAPGWEGEFGVLPGHAALLSLLRGGICTVVTDKGEQRFVVGRGFAEVGPGHVTLLTDVAEPVEGVDKAAAQREIEAAEQAMASLSVESAEFKLAEERLEVARARLRA